MTATMSRRWRSAVVIVCACIATSQATSAQTYGGYHLGEWTVIPSGPMPWFPVVVANDRFLVMAERAVVGQGQVLVGTYDRSGIRWVGAGRVPTAGHFDAVMYGAAVYIISSRSGTIFGASIDVSGALGPWRIAGSFLTSGVRETQAVVVRDHLYLFGLGQSGWGIASAPLLADGALGAWQPLPDIRLSNSLDAPRTIVATRTHIYASYQRADRSCSVDGCEPFAVAVFVAEALPGGSLGNWRQTNASPSFVPLYESAGQFGDYLYNFGHGRLDDEMPVFSERARVLTDGSLVDWEAQTDYVQRIGGTAGTLAGRYAFSFYNGGVVRSVIGSPVVRTQAPDPVPTTGGELVIEGRNFVAGTRVVVGRRELVPVSVTPTMLIVNMPPGAAGSGHLVVINPDGEMTSATVRYGDTSTLVRAPRELTATLGAFDGATAAVTLHWQPPEGATPLSYLFEAGYSPGATNMTFNTGLAQSLFALAPPGRYYTRVRAVYGTGTGPASNEVVVSVATALAPSNLTASVTANRTVTLSWAAAAASTDHILEVGSASGLTNVGAFPISGATVVVPNAPVGTYYVRVRALSAAGLSAPSNEIVVTVP